MCLPSICYGSWLSYDREDYRTWHVVDKIALLAPNATINIVKNYKVVEKQRVKLPDAIKGIVKCDNPSCVSNSNEPVQTRFYVQKAQPLRLKCHYCGHIMEKEEVLKQF